MKKLLLTAVLMGSLNAACVEVITPRDMSLATMLVLQQNLGKKQGILLFNSDFKWAELKNESVVIAYLERLKDPSIYGMLRIWRRSSTLGNLSI